MRKCAMEHRYLMLVAGVVVTLLNATTPIDAEEVSSLDRFQLWNACKPIGLNVQIMPDNNRVPGRLTEAIITSVQSKLRTARLYDEERAIAYLSVTVTRLEVAGAAFSIEGSFLKMFSDPISGEMGMAAPWNVNLPGSGEDPALILTLVWQLTDMFIDEYLRVNASACPHSPS